MEVEMKIRGLMMDPVTNTPIVILKDAGGETVLPIWVGVYEANAIALEIEKVTTPRPMTHDLIKNVLTGLEAQVHKVVVTELREDTFYAVIWLECEGQAISIDSRPSDALALALRVDCPIFVEDEVLKTSKKATTTADEVTSEELGSGSKGSATMTSDDTRCEKAEVTRTWLILPSSCSEFISPVLNSKHLNVTASAWEWYAMDASHCLFLAWTECKFWAHRDGAWEKSWACWWIATDAKCFRRKMRLSRLQPRSWRN